MNYLNRLRGFLYKSVLFSLLIFTFIYSFASPVYTASGDLPAGEIQSGGITVPNQFTSRFAPQNRAPSADGDIDASFNPSVTEGFGFVEEAIVQPDGKVIIGGSFNGVNGAARSYLARINADGSLDATFNPGGAGPNAMVRALALQPDGRILIGGNGATYNGVFRGTVTRLNADGTPDASFNDSGNSAGGVVESIAVQTDGKILIGGSFPTFNGVPRSRIARLNADGSLDATFNPGSGFNNTVLSIVVQPDGKILIGGAFTQYNDAPVGIIVRLNADGNLDSTFNTGAGSANGSVESIVLQPDGRILVGGQFSVFNGAPALGVVRLTASGAIDTVINVPGTASGTVTAVALQANGKILVGGVFNNGASVSPGLLRYNADGSPDTSFAAGAADGSIFSLVVLPDGRILASGGFTRYNGAEQRRLVRLNSAGVVDSTFNVSVNTAGIVHRIATQADGKILIGGDFQLVNGAPRSNFARLNADGSLDSTYNTGSGANGTILALATQADGKIIIGGSFTIYNGAAVNRVARLNTNGSLDTTFNFTRTPFSVSDIKLQPDSKILIGGLFTGTSGATGIVRVNADGSSDPTFNAAAITNTVRAIATQPDGKIMIGGSFTLAAGGVALARLDSNGALDTSFASPLQANGNVEVMTVLPDARILIGGTFSVPVPGSSAVVRNLARLLPNGFFDVSFNTASQNGSGGVSGTVRALLVQPDSKILIGGFFSFFNSLPANRIARLNANGTRDTTFEASADNVVEDIAFQADGKILVGGAFTTLNGAPRISLARLQGSPALATRRVRFDFDGDGRADLSVFRPESGVWYMLNSQSGFTGLAFGQSSDVIVPADYDGDGKTDVAVYRAGIWYLQRSAQGFTGIAFGDGNDIPQPADYDGDGKAELAVFRPSDTYWYISKSSGGYLFIPWGKSSDTLMPGDYDGDGKTDFAVWRKGSTEQSAFNRWYILRSSDYTFTRILFGSDDGFEQSRPAPPADYDGDGKTDVANVTTVVGGSSSGGFPTVAIYLDVFSIERRTLPLTFSGNVVSADYDGDGKADLTTYNNGLWTIRQSTNGAIRYESLGYSDDLLVPADYDGDGKVDIAVWRPSNSYWYWLSSRDGSFNSYQFGLSSDAPTPGDYDGDGRTDFAVVRLENGFQVWYIQQSRDGFRAEQFGLFGDFPLLRPRL
jgi:uncharacterized delta-60 repeat protein